MTPSDMALIIRRQPRWVDAGVINVKYGPNQTTRPITVYMPFLCSRRACPKTITGKIRPEA